MNGILVAKIVNENYFEQEQPYFWFQFFNSQFFWLVKSEWSHRFTNRTRQNEITRFTRWAKNISQVNSCRMTFHWYKTVPSTWVPLPQKKKKKKGILGKSTASEKLKYFKNFIQKKGEEKRTSRYSSNNILFK